ncbi:MAG: hypothetical protein ACRDHZ_02135 [Ktedonobacteraceae bacterium]
MFGESFAGMQDYFRYPERRIGWGGPFNDQQYRQALFQALIDRIKPVAIVETGTFHGTTTAFMAGTGIPLYTIEKDVRRHGFARARFLCRSHVSVYRGDSRKTLRALINGSLYKCRDKAIFVYLDAHWSDDLPLAEELEIVFANCPAAVVMIDDFQVPCDAGYGYDNYGPHKALNSDYIAPVVAAHSLAAFYPSAPASLESGRRRGCIVLARRDVHGEVLASIPLLRSENSSASF